MNGSDKDPGIIPLAIKDIFDTIQKVFGEIIIKIDFSFCTSWIQTCYYSFGRLSVAMILSLSQSHRSTELVKIAALNIVLHISFFNFEFCNINTAKFYLLLSYITHNRE